MPASTPVNKASKEAIEFMEFVKGEVIDAEDLKKLLRYVVFSLQSTYTYRSEIKHDLRSRILEKIRQDGAPIAKPVTTHKKQYDLAVEILLWHLIERWNQFKKTGEEKA